MALKKLAAAAGTALACAAVAAAAQAQGILGQPTPGGIDLQPAASELKASAIFFHNGVLMPIITFISLFVLGLLIYVMVRFNKRANPTPARWSHNTPVEVLWTVVPVLLLMFISIFSFKLLYEYNDMPTPGLTVKATGYQWNWGYEYPDQGIAEYISNMLPEEEARARNVPYRLAADEPMVVPVNTVVRVLTTGADVIHGFALPAFGNKMDSIPGRLNEQWFRADRIGTYYGQCSELCGVDHAFMPIEIQVVSRADFDRWVISRGGNPRGVSASTAAEAAAPAAGPPVSLQPGTVPTTAPAMGAATTGAPGPAPAAGPAQQAGPPAANTPGGAPTLPGGTPMAPTGAAADTPSPNRAATSAANPAARQ